MKIRSLAPALIAIAGLVGVYLWRSGRSDDQEAAKAPTTRVATDSTASPTAPALPPSAPRSAELPAPSSAPSSGGVAPTQAPELSEEENKKHEPKAKLEKMTLEERIAAAKEHVTVIERRVELMQKEIADLEKSGDKAKAEEQRVIMNRIAAHAEKLKKAIAEGREPE